MSRPRRTTHGDYGYAQNFQCDCEPCKLARKRYVKQLAFDHAQGRPRRISAGPIRTHVRALMAQGLREHQIAVAADLPPTVVRNLLRGNNGSPPARWVLMPTAQKLLTLDPDDVRAVNTLVPAIGVQRRIQALHYMGHAKNDIGEVLGVTDSRLYVLMRQESTGTHTIEEIHRVYLKMRDQRGDNEYARWRAFRLGWAPPMAWDDENIDDPETIAHAQVCLIERCRGRVSAHTLCSEHHAEVTRRGGFSQTSGFKKTVDRINRRVR